MFRGSQSNAVTNTKLLGYPVSTSVKGTPIPIVYGVDRVAVKPVWTANWVAKPIGSKLKGGGGKGGAGQQYDYFTSIIMALCHGPIQGTGQMWIDQIRYATSGGGSDVYVEQFTVPPGGGTLVPAFANQIIIDAGVFVENLFSVDVNDYGSPGSATLTGTQQVSLQSVNSGSLAAITVTNPGVFTGTLSVHIIGGGGSGATASIVTEPVNTNPVFQKIASIAIVSPGSGYSVAPTVVFTVSGGAIYVVPQALAALGQPSGGVGALASGQYFFNQQTGSYTFSAAQAGTTVQISYIWNQASALSGAPPVAAIGFEIITGDLGQQPWSFLLSQNPNQALGYSEVALAGSASFELGSTGVISNISFE